MKPISDDLRERVYNLHLEGATYGEIADHFELARSTVQHVVEHIRSTGQVAPKPGRQGRKAAFDAQALRLLEQDVLANPDATLEQLRARSGKAVSLVAIHNTLRKKLGFTRKKSLYVRASSSVPM